MTTAPGTTGTQGWDAVCAIDVGGLNDFLLGWYVGHHPAAPSSWLRTGFTAASHPYLLDLTLGPPRLDFSADQSIQVSRLVVSGSIIMCDDLHFAVTRVTHLDPGTAALTGRVAFAKATGAVQAGSVVLDLGSGDWTLAVQGADADLQQALNTAVGAYYRTCLPVITLCEVRTSTGGACLQPTSFALVDQPDPDDPAGGCLLVMIATNQMTNNKQPGAVAALPTYPIPKGSTAALIVSNAVLFGGVLPDQLTKAIGAAFKGQQAATGAWTTQVVSGSANIGKLQTADGDAWTYGNGSTWNPYPPADVEVPLAGLTLQPAGGALSASYHQGWSQPWDHRVMGGGLPPLPTDYPADIWTTVDYDSTATLQVDPNTCVVTFTWLDTLSSAMDLRGLDGWNSDPSPEVSSRMVGLLKPIFQELTVADIDTLALQSLLFPNHALSLSAGSLPGDLQLTGVIEPSITVTPSLVRLDAGAQPVTFTAATASSSDELVWEPGTLTVSGYTATYTPPASLARPTVVVVSVTDGPDSGGAVIILSPTKGSTPTTGHPAPLTITGSPPLASPVPPGSTVSLSAVAPGGEDLEDLHWVAVPLGIGTLTGTGATATYTAPASQGSSATLRVYAYDVESPDSALFGSVEVTLA